MENKPTLSELFRFMPKWWSRLSPYIIYNSETKLSELDAISDELQPFVWLNEIESPKMLYEFLKSNNDKSIIINCEVLSKSKLYLDILEGAICSSPDSSDLWPVRYKNEKPFIFRGRILILSNSTKESITENKKLHYFARDCRFL